MGICSYVIEVIVFLSCVCTFTLQVVSNEFIYQTVSENYNYTANDSVVFCNGNESKSNKEQIVADEVSRWTMYTYIVSNVTAALTSFFLTTWSDRVGRGRALTFPLIGVAITTIFQASIILYKLPLHFLVINAGILGVFGNIPAIMNISTAHLSDTIPPENRAKRYTIMEVCGSTGGGIALFATGYWIKAKGFLPTSWFLAACSLTNVCLLPFVSAGKKRTKEVSTITGRSPNYENTENYIHVPATKSSSCRDVCTEDQKPLNEIEKCENTKLALQIHWSLAIYTSEYSRCDICDQDSNNRSQLCRHGGGLRRGKVWRLWFYVLSFSLYTFVINGLMSIETMFLLSYPLCFTPELVGDQNGLQFCTIVLVPFLVVFYQSVLHLSNQSILITGIFALFVTSVMMSVALSATLIFIATSLGVFFNLAIPFFRTQVSSLVSDAEQGSALALLSFTGSLVFCLSSIAYLGIYPATLHISHGFVFAISAVLLCFALFLMIIVWIANKRRASHAISEEETPLLS